MYSNISQATSVKNRTFRIAKALPYIAIAIEFLWLILNPQMANSQNYSSQGMRTSIMASILPMIPLVPLTIIGSTDKLIKFSHINATIGAILFIMNAAIFNTGANLQIGLVITTTVYIIIFGSLIVYFPAKIGYGLIKFLIIDLEIQITHGLKWFSWNGYSDKFIAITRKNNIKRFNKLPSISETLSPDATPQEILNTFEKYPNQIKSAKSKHPTW